MTDLLALFVGVLSTTPVVVSTWPTLLTAPSSAEGVFVAPRVCAVPPPTQRLSHALGSPADPSRHTSVASSVTTPLAKPTGHGRGVNKSPCPQGAKGKEAMEIDNNDLGHLSYGLELDDSEEELPSSTIVRDVAGDKGKEAMGNHETYMVVNKGDEPMEIDEASLDHSADVEHLDDRPHTLKTQTETTQKEQVAGEEKWQAEGRGSGRGHTSQKGTNWSGGGPEAPSATLQGLVHTSSAHCRFSLA